MIIKNTDIAAFCDILRHSGQKIVLTNGCFDIIHAGHITYLKKAASFGDCLIVGLNTDASVKRWKSKNRPIVGEENRALVIDSLKFVDYVVLFNETTAEDLVEKIKPAVYVKGGDYTLSTLPEAHILQSYGGRAEFINMVEGCSTTSIINKIKNIY
ncbi:D-glycero-beta-D-manno-heptose 1-phosphate adenylyltransferase [Pectinatus sottacetonis]|uniref:D-glycero-beta-D-manno-heptose 1-phosphate adenylyltransferase n=1 Tax=Pectinatus sottacetonis TaxID=1002795 RepID=UPI0018C50D79|nr:D-glycero-beta-D-manno-heptose 1-phosphate adenylyltransferase [Pectinatus sottacetonis]